MKQVTNKTSWSPLKQSLNDANGFFFILNFITISIIPLNLMMVFQKCEKWIYIFTLNTRKDIIEYFMWNLY